MHSRGMGGTPVPVDEVPQESSHDRPHKGPGRRWTNWSRSGSHSRMVRSSPVGDTVLLKSLVVWTDCPNSKVYPVRKSGGVTAILSTQLPRVTVGTVSWSPTHVRRRRIRPSPDTGLQPRGSRPTHFLLVVRRPAGHVPPICPSSVTCTFQSRPCF